jgi:hypothetical protein
MKNQKPLTIAVVALVAIVVLIILFFVGSQFVGRAIFTSQPQGTAGFAGSLEDIIGQTQFDFVVGANLGTQESVALKILLTFPENVEVEQQDGAITYQIAGPFEEPTDFKRVEFPAPNQLLFETASLDFTQPISGVQELARISFHANPVLTEAQARAFIFNEITVYNLNDEQAGNLITNPILQPSAEPSITVDTDGDGIPDADDVCEDTPVSTPVDATGCPVQTDSATCGDGIIGFSDINDNNIPDAGEYEACDTLQSDSITPNPGCHSTCLFINKDWKVKAGKSCATGSTTCELEELSEQEKFSSRVTSVVNGECYPSNNHPEAEKCDTGDLRVQYANGKLTTPERAELLALLASNLNIFLEATK